MEDRIALIEYFKTISDKLLSMIREAEDAPWADDDQQMLDQLQQLNMDFQFLYRFCAWIGTCDDTCDEQNIERLRSTTIITALQVLWAEKHDVSTFLDRLSKTWPVDVLSFDSLAFELKGIIQQSKPLVQQWCEYLARSSLKSMQHKFSGNILIWEFRYILPDVLDCLSSYIAAKIVPFKNQIDILKYKVTFLYEIFTNPDSGRDSIGRDSIMNFAGAFANNALCLACLYWAKEADQETAIEMNIVLFDTLHKFIPYAPDVIIPISQRLSDSILLSATVASFVDFFFEHLGDDFLILRDPLILLFTSLAIPSHKKATAAAAEEDRLRSQVYALFREHSYLLLSTRETKEVISDKKMLLSDFTTRIRIANAKLRRFYCGTFSDSCNGLEAEKTDYMYFESVARELYFIERHAPWADLVRSQLRLYRMELTFMRLFLLCFTTWDDTDEEVSAKFSFMITSLQGIWRKEEAEKGLLVVRFHAMRGRDAADWHPLASELEGKIQLSKVEMEAWWVNLCHSSFQFKPSTSYKIVEILDSILNILNDLVTYKADKIVPFKKQIETLEEKLGFLKNVLKLTANCIESKELGEFKMLVQVFANDAACLTFLYWAKDANGRRIASEASPMLSQMLQKINPVTPDVARLYFGTLKAIYLLQICHLLIAHKRKL